MTALTAVTAASPVAPTRRRRLATVVALAAGAALALSGCSAGQISQTAEQAAAINGNTADVGAIALRDVHIVYPGSTTTHDNTQGGSAALALSIINTAETATDELTEVTTELGTVEITSADGDTTLEIGSAETVVVSEPSAETGITNKTVDTGAGEIEQAQLTITDLTRDITPGLTYDVTFTFEQSGEVTVPVPVDAGQQAPRKETELSKTTSGSAGGH